MHGNAGLLSEVHLATARALHAGHNSTGAGKLLARTPAVSQRACCVAAPKSCLKDSGAEALSCTEALTRSHPNVRVTASPSHKSAA